VTRKAGRRLLVRVQIAAAAGGDHSRRQNHGNKQNCDQNIAHRAAISPATQLRVDSAILALGGYKVNSTSAFRATPEVGAVIPRMLLIPEQLKKLATPQL
jgi:hypothetical protein